MRGHTIQSWSRNAILAMTVIGLIATIVLLCLLSGCQATSPLPKDQAPVLTAQASIVVQQAAAANAALGRTIDSMTPENLPQAKPQAQAQQHEVASDLATATDVTARAQAAAQQQAQVNANLSAINQKLKDDAANNDWLRKCVGVAALGLWGLGLAFIVIGIAFSSIGLMKGVLCGVVSFVLGSLAAAMYRWMGPIQVGAAVMGGCILVALASAFIIQVINTAKVRHETTLLAIRDTLLDLGGDATRLASTAINSVSGAAAVLKTGSGPPAAA